jgi:hypothetical protein
VTRWANPLPGPVALVQKDIGADQEVPGILGEDRTAGGRSAVAGRRRADAQESKGCLWNQ